MEDPVVPLERNLYGHPLAGLIWERQFEKILLTYVWEKVFNWECSFVHREKGLLLSVYVDDIKLAGKKQYINPTWKVLNKEVDLGEPTSVLDHVYFWLHSERMPLETKATGNLMPKRYLHGPMTWKVMQRNEWKDIANLRLKQLRKFSKSRRHVCMITNSRTTARVAWKVVLYFANRASICSHALILLSPSRWFVMTGWRTSISLQPFGPCCLQASSPPCVSNTFGMWIFVCVHAPVSSILFQTRLDFGSVSG